MLSDREIMEAAANGCQKSPNVKFDISKIDAIFDSMPQDSSTHALFLDTDGNQYFQDCISPVLTRVANCRGETNFAITTAMSLSLLTLFGKNESGKEIYGNLYFKSGEHHSVMLHSRLEFITSADSDQKIFQFKSKLYLRWRGSGLALNFTSVSIEKDSGKTDASSIETKSKSIKSYSASPLSLRRQRLKAMLLRGEFSS